MSKANFKKIQSKKKYKSIKVFSEAQAVLKASVSQNLITYHISNTCNAENSTKNFNACTRGCLAAIYSLKNINPKKIIDLPTGLKLPYFISEIDLALLWAITGEKPRKNFANTFRKLTEELNQDFIQSYSILTAIFCDLSLESKDLFKNTESLRLNEVWV